MKKFLLLLVIVLVGVYGVGRQKLGETGALRFLQDMESKINAGNGEDVCEMFHDDLEVEIVDHTGESTRETTGGKEEFCDLTVTTAKGLNLVPHSSTVNLTEVESKRSWLHPWTGEISYLENRTLSIPAAGVTIRTVSEDEITLVHTFSGVKLIRIRSEIYNAEAT